MCSLHEGGLVATRKGTPLIYNNHVGNPNFFPYLPPPARLHLQCRWPGARRPAARRPGPGREDSEGFCAFEDEQRNHHQPNTPSFVHHQSVANDSRYVYVGERPEQTLEWGPQGGGMSDGRLREGEGGTKPGASGANCYCLSSCWARCQSAERMRRLCFSTGKKSNVLCTVI